jgi:hypothetical protein
MSPSRSRALLGGLVLSSAVVVLGASPAAADPPSPVDQCRFLLLQVRAWPGGGIPGGAHFSDAYDLHLSRQPACATSR